MRPAWLLLSIVVGCGPARPAVAPRATTPPAPGCPASFAAASGATGACTARSATCSYPEGTCSCSAPPWCDGAAPPPDYGDHASWQCTPKVRPDGCPGNEPGEGDPCDHAGQACDYTCACSESATCENGRWHVEHGSCKP